jgi:nucleotide-binding universal stress UspA family protein
LIGVDGSPGSFAAVRQIGHLLSSDADQLALFYSPPDALLRSQEEGAEKMNQRARQALGTAVFEEAKTLLPPEFAEHHETILGSGNPRHHLVEAATEWDAELIGVGARGIGPFKKLLVGSVSMSVAQQAPVPVYVARTPRQRPPGEPMRILLACDAPELGRTASETLHRFHWAPGTKGHVVSVIESMFVGHVPEWLEEKARSADTEAISQVWVHEHEAERKAKAVELQNLCQGLPAPFAESAPIVREGNAAEQILQVIAEEQIDLCVVGAHGKGLWERLVMGSTSEKVLTHAPCSVMVVRQDHP